MEIINTSKGTYDLDTNEGRYKYVAEFLVSKGARGDILSCLEKLYSSTEKLEEKLEIERMRVVACGTAAIANTIESIAHSRIDQSSPYYSSSYRDVCDAVDREIKYRMTLERLSEDCGGFFCDCPDIREYAQTALEEK